MVVVVVLPKRDRVDLFDSLKEKADFVASLDGFVGCVGWPNAEVGLLAPKKEGGSAFAG